MGKPSVALHLKPEITKAFRDGAKPSEVLKKYPGLPKMTCYRWYRSLNDTGSETDGLNATERHPPSLVAIDGKQQQSDIQLARTALRRIVKGGPSIPPAIQVQAAAALMKLAYLRYELPKHILEETEESGDLQTVRDRIRDLSPEDIAKRCREAFG